MWKKSKLSANYLNTYIKDETIDVAIILGSGLENLKDKIQIKKIFSYEKIPNFPKTTVQGHSGKLIFGILAGKNVLLMSGRFHYYEGYSMQQVTFPIRVFYQLGIKNLIVSNASGGVNPKFKIGDIMLIKDHINMFPEHPLRGKNIDKFGPRFVDMSKPYDIDFLSTALQIAKKNNINIHVGVYVGFQGPTFETPSEYGMARILGGDAVGMSTIPEIIVARHQEMRCFAISVISDLGGSNLSSAISHEDVLIVSQESIFKVIPIIVGLVAKL